MKSFKQIKKKLNELKIAKIKSDKILDLYAKHIDQLQEQLTKQK